jgi:hypothetical protein
LKWQGISLTLPAKATSLKWQGIGEATPDVHRAYRSSRIDDYKVQKIEMAMQGFEFRMVGA